MEQPPYNAKEQPSGFILILHLIRIYARSSKNTYSINCKQLQISTSRIKEKEKITYHANFQQNNLSQMERTTRKKIDAYFFFYIGI